MWIGLRVFNELSSGLRSFMETNGYGTIDDFRGIALKYLTTVEELAKEEPMYDQSMHGSVMAARSVGVCANDAISMESGKAKIDIDRCDGCSLCKAWCPTKAFELK